MVMQVKCKHLINFIELSYSKYFFWHSDNLNKSIQHTRMSASGVQSE